MNKKVIAIVATAGFFVAYASAANIPAAQAAPGAAPTNQQQIPANQSPNMNPAPAAPVTPTPLPGIKKADQTIAEIYAGQNNLANTVVNVRGKVVKFNPEIMGKNWVHIQDGSGAKGTNDLTVTTTDTAKIDDIVLVSGKITLKKDFGGGYKYDVIVEDGKVLVEAK